MSWLLRKALILTAVLLICSASGWAQAGPAAVVHGEPLTEDQVLTEAAADLRLLEQKREQFEAQSKRERHTMLEKALTRLIDERLFAIEANARNISVDELLQREVDARALVNDAS